MERAADPLNEEAVSPHIIPDPMVSSLVVFAVIVALPPREMDDPFTVMELLDNFAFAMEPESIVPVTVPVSPVVISVPVTSGRVNVLLAVNVPERRVMP